MVVNLYLFAISFLKVTNAINLLSSTPAAVNEVLTVCPEDSFSITCSHTNTGAQQTRWTLSTSSSCTVAHDGSLPPVCTPFTVSMISDSSGSSLTSTIEATGYDVQGIPFIICQAGGLQSSTLVGNITLRVIYSPSVGPIEYSVESATTGRAKFTVHSQGSLGSPVTYTGSVVGGSGSVTVTDNHITVTGLDYTQPHMVTVVAANTHSCPSVGTNKTVPLSFSTAPPLLSSLNISIMCSSSSLPIRVSWTVIQGVQASTNSSVSLIPPLNTIPTVFSFSAGGRSDSTSSDSPYMLMDTVRNDSYTFNVSASNAAGKSFTAASYDVPTNVITVDQSSVDSSNICLRVMLSQKCYDSISNESFSVRLQYAFGDCKNLPVSNYTTLSIKMPQYSTCLPVNRGTNDFCYRATLLYQQAIEEEKVIDVVTNLNFNFCSIAELRSILSDGVTFELDGLDSNTSVPHLTTATLTCDSTNMALQGLPNTSCHNGVWSSSELHSCSNTSSMRGADGLIVVIILVVLLVVYLMGTFCGLVIGHHWQRCSEALSNKEIWAIVVIIVLSFTFGLGFGILIHYIYSQNCCSKCEHCKPEKNKQTKSKSSSPPPPDSLYADPNAIEHKTTSTGAEYALVDVKGKKEKKNVVQHETVPSGDAYALIDKMKTGCSKKEQPDVVPPTSKEGLSYAKVHIDTTLSNPKPLPGQDLSVEYATIEQMQEKST